MIDYTGIRNKNQNDLNSFITDNLSALPGQSKESTSRLLSNQPLISNLASIPNVDQAGLKASIATGSPENARKVNERASQIKYQQSGAYQQALYESIYNKAKDFGLADQAAQNFARQYLVQKKQQDFQAQQAEQQRQFNQTKANLGDMYAQQGVNLQNAYSSSLANPQAAINRMVTGIGTSLLTGYALNKYGKKQPDMPYVPSPYDTPSSNFDNPIGPPTQAQIENDPLIYSPYGTTSSPYGPQKSTGGYQ